MKYKLTKLEAHPERMTEQTYLKDGDVLEGDYYAYPTPGCSFLFECPGHKGGGIVTSVVREVTKDDDGNTIIKTMNSYYKLEKL